MMKNNTLNWITGFFKYLLFLCAILYIFAFLFVVFSRIQYPFELQWHEGAAVDHVRWILSGQKYYVEPSLEFVSSAYTPLYFYLSAAVSSLLGIGFMPLRLVSFVSSLGSLFIIFLIVKKETGNSFAGILASCLFAATYRLSGAWFDLARVDSLFLFLLLMAIYLIKFQTSLKSYVLAGILISLSFYTKQTALIISLPVMLYSVFLNRRSAFSLIGTVVVIIGGGSIILNYVYDSWYNYYVFELPGSARYIFTIERAFINFWIKEIISVLSIACVLSIFYLLAQFLDSSKKNFLFYFLIALGMIGGAWSSRLHGGSNENVLLPAHAVISILFGLGLHTFLEFIKTVPTNKQNLLKIFIYLICILQFSSGSLRYNPFDQIPSQEDLQAGRKFINIIEQIDGEIFVPFHGYLPLLAGKKTYVHSMGMQDVLFGKSSREVREKFINDIGKAIQNEKFSAIILDSRDSKVAWYPPEIMKHYVKQRRIFDDETVFLPVAGMKTRPEFIYVPKSKDTQ